MDEIGEPILGVGKCEKDHTNKKIKCGNKSHFNLMFTSLKLMKHIEYEGMFHIRWLGVIPSHNCPGFILLPPNGIPSEFTRLPAPFYSFLNKTQIF